MGDIINGLTEENYTPQNYLSILFIPNIFPSRLLLPRTWNLMTVGCSKKKRFCSWGTDLWDTNLDFDSDFNIKVFRIVIIFIQNVGYKKRQYMSVCADIRY